ncbi:MAG: hypothetical protein HUU50_02520 [Candidatus Brocadiae bacterium]|nr:hypothetical protein [Candidatus Brocadiia bacterium]
MDLDKLYQNILPVDTDKILRPLIAAQLINAYYTALQSKIAPGETATNDFIKTVWFEVINNWKVMNFCLNELEHRDIADLYKNVYDGIPKVLKEKDIP